MSAKNRLREFAIFDGEPTFAQQVPVGQMYFPSWERYESAMRGVFARDYYTNQGPLARELEERLAEFLGVAHVVCVTNATIGLIMAVKALSLTGKVIVPSFTFIASAQSISWAGLEPVFCDVDPRTHQIRPEYVEPLLDESVTAILGVNLWGGSCDPLSMESFAKEKNLNLYFDSAQGFGCTVDGSPLGRFGSMEVFSFHATKVLSATEGGCVCTNDDELAARLRNIRSSYGAGRPVDVPLTSNGRFSEAQAAIALLSLEDLPLIRARNEMLYDAYRQGIEEIPGIRLVEPTGVETTNHQSVVCEVEKSEFGLSRDTLLSVIKSENLNARRYFYPGAHRSIPYSDRPTYKGSLPNTDALCDRVLQLPIGGLISDDVVQKAVELLASVQRHTEGIASRLSV